MKSVYSFTNSKNQEYFLHMRDVKLKNGNTQRIYFFARDQREGMLDEVPEGFEAIETSRTGMPVLRKLK